VALGCLGWMPNHFEDYTLSDLIKACEGRDEHLKIERDTQVEIARAVSFYSVIGSAKKGFKYSDIAMPWDKVIKKELKMARVTKREK